MFFFVFFSHAENVNEMSVGRKSEWMKLPATCKQGPKRQCVTDVSHLRLDGLRGEGAGERANIF